MDGWVIAIFAAVYAGMMLGRFPGLALDRSGIALLGAIAVLAVTRAGVDDAVSALDAPTLALLFGLMVVSAQFRIGGAYGWLTRRLVANRVGPNTVLALVIFTSGALSAALANDIIALAMAPVLVEVASGKRLNPLPLLLGLAAGANIGSAATLVGNPQNILIGQSLDIDFAAYTMTAIVPSILGLVVAWAVLSVIYRNRWSKPSSLSAQPELIPFNLVESGKGAVVLVIVMTMFIGGWWPREMVALAAAAVLLVNRRVATRQFMFLVDWQLLLLFAGLFVVNAALAATGAPSRAADWLASVGADPRQAGWLFVSAAFLSNLVSNVPAVMLLLPYADSASLGAALALSSTLAGNMLVVSSIANIIVVDQAGRLGLHIDWREHARAGIPITLVTLAVAAVWLAAFW